MAAAPKQSVQGPGGSTRSERIAARKQARKDARIAARRKAAGGTTNSNPATAASTGTGGTTATAAPGGTASGTSEQTGMFNQFPTAGDMTSASTTAPVPSDTAADQSDANLDAFFGSGSSSTPQYDDSVSAAETSGDASGP